ncbi:MAG: zinc ribbon domain-containing protein [Phycisphaerales bacterium]|nr:zinc ribbon domain-containing protein [Phycisphaerales bacterium]MCB9855959.1 zinc ribbon domain-containing protein [Phycisphaerales bacterium]MCB9864060.1 zinc ribbon domain-containing protein [Phycisphaerales bacterium]
MAFACPHCNSENAEGASYCRSCGKALPNPASTGPRIIEPSGFATTAAGSRAQTAELQAQIKKASGALLAVAIIQWAVGALLYFLRDQFAEIQQIDPDGMNIVLAAVAIIGIVFFGLYLWSRKSPFPAAVVGLVVFVTLHLVEALIDPTTLYKGLLVKIIIIAILVGAVRAGVRYRAIKRQTEQ